MPALRWKPGIAAKIGPDFAVLVDDQVHAQLVANDGEIPLMMACYRRYSSNERWAFDVVDEPVTCMFCLAGTQRW